MNKIALCFLISYDHIIHKEHLWRQWIEPNRDIINVYIHYDKNKYRQIKSDWIRQHCIPPQLVHKTTYFNVVPGYISVLSFAFKHDIKNAWFCMLTESCVPIVSPIRFREMFMQYYAYSVFHWRPAYWNIQLHHRANLRLLKQEYHLANDPWFVLTRKHVQQTMVFVAGKNNIYDRVVVGGLANESIFAIILQTFHELSSPFVINQISTLADWSRMSSPSSPYLFVEGSEENRRKIDELLAENEMAMFLRKVAPQFPDEFIVEKWNQEVVSWNRYFRAYWPIMYSIRFSCAFILAFFIGIAIYVFV